MSFPDQNDKMDGVLDAADSAAQALDNFARGPAAEAASLVGKAFDKAGDRITKAMGRAAETGKFSFKGMVSGILQDLSRLAIEQGLVKPLSMGLENVVKGLPFFGARADGGPVTPGGAYLVGERGPELFRPTGAGEIVSDAASWPRRAPVTVNMHFGPGSDVESFRRSESQITAALARAVASGQGHL